MATRPRQRLSKASTLLFRSSHLKNISKKKPRSNRNIKSGFIEFVLQKFNEYPELNEDLTLQKLTEHRELLDMIYAVLSTPVTDEDGHLWGLCAPITPLVFYGTDALFDVLVDPETGHVKNAIVETQIDIVQTKRPELIYTLILLKVYKFQQAFHTELVKTFRDEHTGLHKYFKLLFDMRFLDVHPKQELPDLSSRRHSANTARTGSVA